MFTQAAPLRIRLVSPNPHPRHIISPTAGFIVLFYTGCIFLLPFVLILLVFWCFLKTSRITIFITYHIHNCFPPYLLIIERFVFEIMIITVNIIRFIVHTCMFFRYRSTGFVTHDFHVVLHIMISIKLCMIRFTLHMIFVWDELTYP